LLALRPNSLVLEIGCGFGSLTEGLQQMGCRVIAVDGVSERVAFTAMRCTQQGLDTGQFLTGCLTKLTLAPASLGAVVMNRLREWLPHADSKAPTDQLLQEALRQVHPWLIPGGELYLEVENRLSWAALEDRYGGTVGRSHGPLRSRTPRAGTLWEYRR